MAGFRGLVGSVAAQAKLKAVEAMLGTLGTLVVQRVSVMTPALSLVTSSQDIQVTWPAPFADASYHVSISVQVNGITAGKITATVKGGTQTAAGVVVTVTALGIAIGSGQVVDILAVHP